MFISKFRENFKIALPAALVTLVIILVLTLLVIVFGNVAVFQQRLRSSRRQLSEVRWSADNPWFLPGMQFPSF